MRYFIKRNNFKLYECLNPHVKYINNMKYNKYGFVVKTDRDELEDFLYNIDIVQYISSIFLIIYEYRVYLITKYF